MPEWKLNLFVRVVRARVANEGNTADEILAEYPKLTTDEINEIRANI